MEAPCATCQSHGIKDHSIYGGICLIEGCPCTLYRPIKEKSDYPKEGDSPPPPI